jgi:hypothetical protein
MTIQLLGISPHVTHGSREPRGRAHAVVAIGVLRDELEVGVGANHRSRVSRQRHDRERAKDGVDGAALETEVAEVSARQQSAVRLEELGSCTSPFCCRSAPLGRWLLMSRLELQLLGPNTRHPDSVADKAHWFRSP